ncbi:DUF3087 domain-containing protein [Psychromonas ossibalaenae]|uniref:DUF3087 domain-containing protein n=1 Tax=Psychromonas ossibalaenae TaxID=444922 RepID=UPI00037FC572|nr:DUF3087 domain-containing protein [Psychromonas ossibalaenae]
MQLKEINKQKYRRHLNIVILFCIVFLTIGSLVAAQILIMFFPSESGTHFHWNLIGVISCALSLLLLLVKFKTHVFMTEVTYVWELKQVLNQISRKMTKLKVGAENGCSDAMTAIHFSYAGSRQLWLLDDNTLNMNSLVRQQEALEALAVRYDLTLDVNAYHSDMLNGF